MIYIQNYNPLPWGPLCILLASMPVLVLFFLLVVRRAPVPWAAAGGAIAALVIAVAVYGMPANMAALAFLNGALFALVPICWTIINAMLLYNLTVVTGRFEGIKDSVAGLSADHRLQAVLIAFSFGAFLEGAAGGGTPVAICGAMMVGLGFPPFQAACLCLIANTSPVAYGGFGTPILTLQAASGLPAETLSHMAGNQLPFLSFIIPLWLVRCMCGWRDTFAVLPAILVAGTSFSVIQYLFAHSPSFPLTDIAGGLISLVITAVFLRFWRPAKVWRMSDRAKGGDAAGGKEAANAPAPAYVVPRRMSSAATLGAWMPFIILCLLMVIVGSYKKPIDAGRIGPVKTVYEFAMPGLDKHVRRTPPVVEKPTLESATFKLNWMTSPGTPIFITNLIALALLRINRRQLRSALLLTWRQMAIPVPTIVFMIGLSSVTRLGGLDATLGMAFANAKGVYPFFAALLGWIGVFLTGTDAGSNALFGSLQKITALQLRLNPILICAANSTGGVMGKMIDAQSICVATAATERVGTEADIFKYVVWHSIALAAIVGCITLLQAYVPPFTHMVPHWP
jgi:L-lactate transport